MSFTSSTFRSSSSSFPALPRSCSTSPTPSSHPPSTDWSSLPSLAHNHPLTLLDSQYPPVGRVEDRPMPGIARAIGHGAVQKYALEWLDGPAMRFASGVRLRVWGRSRRASSTADPRAPMVGLAGFQTSTATSRLQERGEERRQDKSVFVRCVVCSCSLGLIFVAGATPNSTPQAFQLVAR